MYAGEPGAPPDGRPGATVTDRDVRDNAGKVTVDALIDSHVFGVWL